MMKRSSRTGFLLSSLLLLFSACQEDEAAAVNNYGLAPAGWWSALGPVPFEYCEDEACQKTFVSSGFPLVSRLSLGKDDDIWLLTPNELYRYRNQEDFILYDRADGLPHNARLTAMLVRSNEDIWVADTAGISVLAGAQGLKERLPYADVQKLVETAEGTVYFYNARGVWKHMGNNTTLVYETSGNCAINDIHHAEVLWIATNCGLLRLSTSSALLRDFSDISTNTVAAAEDGSVYAANGQGIFVNRGDGWKLLDERFGAGRSFPPFVNSLLPLAGGRLWIAQEEGGLVYWDGQTAESYYNIDPRFVNARQLLGSADGRLWLLDDSGQLMFFTPN